MSWNNVVERLHRNAGPWTLLDAPGRVDVPRPPVAGWRSMARFRSTKRAKELQRKAKHEAKAKTKAGKGKGKGKRANKPR